MSRMIVLMYHALYADAAERGAIDAADRPYAVSLANFDAQLDWLADAGIPVADPTTPSMVPLRVALTFDDGHESNFKHAFPRLRQRGWKGVFFVTSDFIGRRPGFCNWAQLRDMAAGGMTIGSHGKTHRFLDDLSQEEFEEELRGSRAAIADGTGLVPTLMSFPGGRYRRNQLLAARSAGFDLFFSSEPGANRGGEVAAGTVLRRMALRDVTDLPAFARIAGGDPALYRKARVIGALKNGLRRLAGNRLYHALYERFAA